MRLKKEHCNHAEARCVAPGNKVTCSCDGEWAVEELGTREGEFYTQSVARFEAARQPAWDNPTGLPYLDGAIGEWVDGSPTYRERRADGNIIVSCGTASGGGFRWALWTGYEVQKGGGVATLDAAKNAADRALMREVFTAWEFAPIAGEGYGYSFGDGRPMRKWTVAHVREILEGAAKPIKVEISAVDNATPALEKVIDAMPALIPAPSITDAQLSEIVTGLPLGGGVIGARIGQNATRSCWRRHLCSRGVTVYQSDKGGGMKASPSIVDADRQLLTWAMGEAQTAGLLGCGRDRHGDYVTIAALGGHFVTRRMLADLRAALPDFDWSGVPGGSKIPDVGSIPALPPAAQDPPPFDPWPLTERECSRIVAEVLNEVGDFADDAAECADDVRAYARWIARWLHGFDPLDTAGHDAWLEANLEDGAEAHILCNVDWRWQTAMWRWLG